VYWFLKKLYKLISYNRRIIVANTTTTSCGIDCKPDYNFKYRFLFILLMMTGCFITTITTVVLNPFLLYGVVFLFMVAVFLFIWLSLTATILAIAAQISIICFLGACLLLLTALLQQLFTNTGNLVTGAGLAFFAMVIIKQSMLRLHFIVFNKPAEM
jgi:hypothetical protein